MKAYEKACELDNGIKSLVSGGDSESMNKWYRDMEAVRTPTQRENEITQKLCWNDYHSIRVKAIKFIKAAQSADYPVFAIPAYDGVWDTFKAPDAEEAQKFLWIKNNSSRYPQEIIKASNIKPQLEEIHFA